MRLEVTIRDSDINAAAVPTIARGELNTIFIDWGENTAGQETGALKAGDTVASCVVVVDSKPPGASDPTLGSVAANGSSVYVNRRSCSAGEATTCNITAGASQVEGLYRLKFTATTTGGKILPRFVVVNVGVPS